GFAARLVNQSSQGFVSPERDGFPVEVLAQANQRSARLAPAQQQDRAILQHVNQLSQLRAGGRQGHRFHNGNSSPSIISRLPCFLPMIATITLGCALATGIRSPRIQGTPAICAESAVIRVNFTLRSSSCKS